MKQKGAGREKQSIKTINRDNGNQMNDELNKTLTAYVLALGAWVCVFWSDFARLVHEWGHDDYSHCYLVMPLVGYIIWTNKRQILESIGGKSFLGYLLCLLAVGLYMLGRLGSLKFFVYISMWLFVCGGILIALGHKAFRGVWMALLVGFFSIPLPNFITKITSLKLRLISSVISEKMLQVVGVPVYREGNVIDLGSIQLQVVDACSGLRYLWPSILMALLVGWFFMKRPWKRVVLLLFAIPVTILSNAFRIALTGILTKFIDPALAEGFFHDFSGWLVYILSLGILGLCALLLNRYSPDPAGTPEDDDKPLPPLRTSAWWHGVVIALILGGAFLAQSTMLKNLSLPERKDLVSFPVSIGDWTGKRSTLSEAVIKSLGSDDYLNGVYRNSKTGDVVYVLFSWYDHQTTAHAAHAPTSCLVGGGWDVMEKRVLPPSANGDRPFPVTQMILNREGQPLISNFSFLQRGRVVVSEWWNKWYLLVDSVVLQRTDGGLLRLEMPVRPGRSPNEAQAELDKFAGLLWAELRPYLPEGY